MCSVTNVYKQKVWVFLDNMKPGERYKIEKICERENYNRFVAHIKEWMAAFPYQGGLSFNHDYSEFYMTHVPD